MHANLAMTFRAAEHTLSMQTKSLLNGSWYPLVSDLHFAGMGIIFHGENIATLAGRRKLNRPSLPKFKLSPRW